MKKVDLDKEYEVFKERFFFSNGGEEAWREYQECEGLMDRSNEYEEVE